MFLILTSLVMVSCSESVSEHKDHKNKHKDDHLTLTDENAASQKWFDNEEVFSTSSGYVEFTTGFSGTVAIFTGNSKNLTGYIDLQKNEIELELDLTTLRTGIIRRDSDIFELLNAFTNPMVHFKGTFEPAFDQNSNMEQVVKASGKFTLNGIERDITADGFLKKMVAGILLDAGFTLDIVEHDIIPPRIYTFEMFKDQEVRMQADFAPGKLALLE
ncbi:YceI family protein [Natronogracilivirga saccharolytica]|uniref:YceI family protein n=1 Tax=Natronogracilivirga saccharolytica TaxID=2812953 RepID=A0A8J7S3N5_9BACT|nr:YceI family protein [Natronogracilivirga saccharolytica]MBP3191398.1 YceI family protein [Natronogracilivirga saccharolytica]